MPLEGWLCPSCGKAHAPDVKTCPEPGKANAVEPLVVVPKDGIREYRLIEQKLY